MSHRPLLVAFAFAHLLCAQQGAWSVVPGDPAPPRWATGAMAFDRARGITVLVNGSDVWESSGTAWRLVSSVANTGGSGGGFAYDHVRGRCLYYGGFLFFGNQLSEWDGTSWRVVPTTRAPQPRMNMAMAYDVRRSRMVLFGGWTGTSYPADTWEFDGVDWQQATPLASPPGMSHHRMTYDTARGEIVLYVNQAGTTGCWLYDGITWRAAPPPGPTPLNSPALVYDEARARTVLTSSSSSASPQVSTWEWDGTSWTNPQPNGPQLTFAVNGAYDSVRGLVQVVGTVGDGLSTWRWTGAQWERGTPFGTLPSWPGIAVGYHAPTAAAVAFGGARSVFGSAGAGTDDTYEYRRGGWRLTSPPTRPGARGHAAMAGEPSADLLLFGGQHLGTALGDTWRWTGSTWTQLAPTTSPPARSGHGMATDLARGRIVLFGGQGGAGTALGDTWEWDGANWLLRTPAVTPGARIFPAMTFDQRAARTLLFGGGTATLFADDLWQWDGSTWTPRAVPVRPTARGGASFTFDPRGGVAVLAGGFQYGFLGTYGAVAETWLWDDVQWTQVTATAPGYDPNAVGLYHGQLASTLYSSPVTLTPLRFPTDHEFAFGSVAAATTFGVGCPGATGAPQLSAVSVPRTGNSAFALWLSNAQAGAFAWIGFDAQSTSIPLGNGCQALLPSPVFRSAVADAFGNALVPLPIPPIPALHGMLLHAQGIALDPAGALFGAGALTAGLRLVLSS